MPFEMLGFSPAKLETRHHDKELLHKIFASLLNHNHPPMKVLLSVWTLQILQHLLWMQMILPFPNKACALEISRVNNWLNQDFQLQNLCLIGHHIRFFFSEKKSFNFALQLNDITDFLKALEIFVSTRFSHEKKSRLFGNCSVKTNCFLCINFMARFAIDLSLFRDQVANDDYTL